MWMSELSERSGLPLPTIKYYLRERLLHPGESVGATRSKYDDTHVRRLRLVRALTEVAGMRLDDVRRVLAAVEDPDLSWHEAIGSAHTRLPPPTSSEPDTAQLEHVDALLRRHGWELSEASPHRNALAGALASLSSLGHLPGEELLDTYVEAATLIAEREIAGVRTTGDRVDAAERAVVSTLLLEPVLLTLRRIAQENASRRIAGG